MLRNNVNDSHNNINVKRKKEKKHRKLHRNLFPLFVKKKGLHSDTHEPINTVMTRHCNSKQNKKKRKKKGKNFGPTITAIHPRPFYSSFYSSGVRRVTSTALPPTGEASRARCAAGVQGSVGVE